MQTLIDHDTESERDALGDVEPLQMKVDTTNVCQPTVELVSVRYNSRRRIRSHSKQTVAVVNPTGNEGVH